MTGSPGPCVPGPVGRGTRAKAGVLLGGWYTYPVWDCTERGHARRQEGGDGGEVAKGSSADTPLSQLGPAPHLRDDCTSLGAPPGGPLGTAVCPDLGWLHPPGPSFTRQGLLPAMPSGKLRPRQAGTCTDSRLCLWSPIAVPHKLGSWRARLETPSLVADAHRAGWVQAVSRTWAVSMGFSTREVETSWPRGAPVVRFQRP